MSFYEISEKILNEAFTENGDKAYVSTGSLCLDYFSLVGGMRYNLKDALNLFLKSYYEDPIMSIKILFYVRDIREGLGERDLFRYTFNVLANMYPEVAKQLIEYIPEYGRYDDLLICLETPLKDYVLEYIDSILKEDIENKKNNKGISLLAKWLPSINTSSYETRHYAKIIAKGLGMSYEEYRKTLSSLRKDLIVENNLREKDYTFSYDTLPGGAMFKYRNAFLSNDNERYNKYLEDLSSGKAKMNANTIYPYEVIRRFEKGVREEEVSSLDAIWNSFDRSAIDSKTIVVRDGSYSMYDYNSVSAHSVATSLAILFAEQLTGEFKNKFITFSMNPKIVEVKGKTIQEKYECLTRYDEAANTDIGKVYKLILRTYKHKDFKKEDAIDRIVIISDMEFDQCVEDASVSTFEHFKKEFENIGYDMPEVVFWNVRARDVHFPVMNEFGVKLVSGASAKIISMVINNESKNAYDFMIECLEKYSCFDKIKI